MELKAGIQHVLQMIRDDVVEGHARVLRGIDQHAGGQRRVASELLQQMGDDDPVLLGEVGAKALVKVVDDLRQWRDSVSNGDKVVLGGLRIQLLQVAFERDRAPSPIHSQLTGVQRR